MASHGVHLEHKKQRDKIVWRKNRCKKIPASVPSRGQLGKRVAGAEGERRQRGREEWARAVSVGPMSPQRTHMAWVAGRRWQASGHVTLFPRGGNRLRRSPEGLGDSQ